MSDEEVIQAAVSVIMDAALGLLQADPHSWSNRPCPTCRGIQALTGKVFGCYVFQQQHERKP